MMFHEGGSERSNHSLKLLLGHIYTFSLESRSSSVLGAANFK